MLEKGSFDFFANICKTIYKEKKRNLEIICSFPKNKAIGSCQTNLGIIIVSIQWFYICLISYSCLHNAHEIAVGEIPRIFQKDLQQTVTSIFYKQMNGCGKYPLKWLMDFYKYN